MVETKSQKAMRSGNLPKKYNGQNREGGHSGPEQGLKWTFRRNFTKVLRINPKRY